MFKIWWTFQNRKKKTEKKVFRFWDNCIWIGNCKFSASRTGYLSSAVTVLTNTPKILNFNQGDISQIILSPEWLKNMIKVLWCRFYKCLKFFNMLSVERWSETTQFGEWSNQVFDSLECRKYIGYNDNLLFEKV